MISGFYRLSFLRVYFFNFLYLSVNIIEPMRKFIYLFLVLISMQVSVGKILFAQSIPVSTSADVYISMQKLKVLGSVLYVAAHPDDENTRLLTYLSKDKLYRTGYLSVTRGDGGQNLIGNEQGIELGMIRTQELLAARRIDGGEQFFTRAYDFGYSKSPEETFSKWDKEKILSDVVWIIRKFQPDVIITRFPTTSEGGHGHHIASAILANEAFAAAANPSKFPEQLKYVKPWQAKRILWNTFNFGGINTTSESQFKIDVGGYNPLLGKSYGEIAAESRSQHKSQGFGVARTRGEAFEFFRTNSGTAPENDLMDGLETGWKKLTGGIQIEKSIDSLIRSFDFVHPEKSVKSLVRLHTAINSINDAHWKNQKLEEVKNLIEMCSGLWMDAVTSSRFAVQTDSLRVHFSFNNRLGSLAILKKLTIDDFDSTFNLSFEKNKNINFSKTFLVPDNKPITQPYWLVDKMEEGYFNVADQQKIGQPDMDPSYFAYFTLNIEGQDIVFKKPVDYKFTDPVRGELYQPLVVLPPVLVSPDEFVKISRDSNSFKGVLNITAKKKNINVSVKDIGLLKNEVIKSSFSPAEFTINEKDKTQSVDFTVKAQSDNEYDFRVSTTGTTKLYNQFLHEIKYDHIPYQHYFEQALVTNKKLDLKTVGKKIGYIIGAGDKVPEALEQMGYEVVLLGDKELSRNNLQQFDAIITGVRAYNTNDWIGNHYDRLMSYVKEGGNLIVQYNTNNFISSLNSKLGPYKFDISRNRITDENAIVNFVKPEHRVLNFPNKITQDDFKDWKQERSIYHAGNRDVNYETILSMKDPGEKEDEGSLIVTDYGKGTFVYTGLVFFRELPAGVPGAYRLLANIIALNSKKSF